jgi:tRNA-modifying protein YgfZ
MSERTVTQNVTTYVVAEAERGVLAVSGSDRVAWLNGVVTCDTTLATPERAVFGLLLSKQGKIQTDFWLLASEARLFLAVAPNTAELVRAEFDRMLVMEDAELEDMSADLVLLTLIGPKARELARSIASKSQWTMGDVDRPGLGGAVLLLPRADLDATVATLQAAGAVRPDAAEWQQIRLERQVAVFGADYGPGDNPHEAGLDRSAVSWSKGCYLGQEVVFMQDARGRLKRRLVPLSVPAGLPAVGAELRGTADEVVGEVTSVAPAGEGAIALARVKAPHFEPGTKLAVAGFPAEVAAGPVSAV